jgi:GR25 family glycosyltransferase involved in LPS biosynthesis
MKVLYINRITDKDRNLYMKQQLETMQFITYDRVNAISYEKKEDVLRFLQISTQNKKDTELYWKKLAVIASHLKAIKSAYDMNIDDVIISEDDIDLSIYRTHSIEIEEYLQNSKRDMIQLHTSSMEGRLMYRSALNQRTLTLGKRKSAFWGATFYYISRNGMERIMQFFNRKTNQFDIDRIIEQYACPFNYLVSDYILYKITDADVLSLPIVNISSPDLLPSTMQNIDHIALAHIHSYIFVNKYSNTIIDIIKNNLTVNKEIEYARS